jgi:hypothetical protein
MERSTAQFDLEIAQGSSFSIMFTWKTSDYQIIPLTDFTARMQIREDKESDVVLVDLDSDGHGLTINGPAGSILLELSSAQTETFPSGDLVYDLKITDPDGKSHRFIEGTATVDRAVTRV